MIPYTHCSPAGAPAGVGIRFGPIRKLNNTVFLSIIKRYTPVAFLKKMFHTIPFMNSFDGLRESQLEGGDLQIQADRLTTLSAHEDISSI